MFLEILDYPGCLDFLVLQYFRLRLAFRSLLDTPDYLADLEQLKERLDTPDYPAFPDFLVCPGFLEFQLFLGCPDNPVHHLHPALLVSQLRQLYPARPGFLGSPCRLDSLVNLANPQQQLPMLTLNHHNIQVVP